MNWVEHELTVARVGPGKHAVLTGRGTGPQGIDVGRVGGDGDHRVLGAQRGQGIARGRQQGEREGVGQDVLAGVRAENVVQGVDQVLGRQAKRLGRVLPGLRDGTAGTQVTEVTQCWGTSQIHLRVAHPIRDLDRATGMHQGREVTHAPGQLIGIDPGLHRMLVVDAGTRINEPVDLRGHGSVLDQGMVVIIPRPRTEPR